MDSGFEDHAYQDKPFPIGADQTISQPYTVAFQTELLQLKPGDKVLEIGTGSGYQTAVLLFLKAKVYTVERQLSLFKKTKLFFEKMGYRPRRLVCGDGYKGMPEEAPFDGILVTAGAPRVPNALLAQLTLGGRLVNRNSGWAKAVRVPVLQIDLKERSPCKADRAFSPHKRKKSSGRGKMMVDQFASYYRK